MLLCVQVPTLLLWEQRDVSTTDQVNDVVKKTIEVETEETEAILTTEEATTMIEIVEVILTTEEVMTKTEVETEVILVVVSSFSLKKNHIRMYPVTYISLLSSSLFATILISLSFISFQTCTTITSN